MLRSNIDSKPNSDGDVLEAVGLNFVGIIGGSSINCPPVGVVCIEQITKSINKGKDLCTYVILRHALGEGSSVSTKGKLEFKVIDKPLKIQVDNAT